MSLHAPKRHPSRLLSLLGFRRWLSAPVDNRSVVPEIGEDAPAESAMVVLRSRMEDPPFVQTSRRIGAPPAEAGALIEQLKSGGLQDVRVLEALRSVPRHEFVPDALQARAYENAPLPIGNGQTISQPFVVAFMTGLLQPKPGDLILEIGTGCGYQAAVLAELAKEVVTVEIIEELARSAGRRLDRLGYDNVTVVHGDGYFGWPERAPYDGILVASAASHVPRRLLAQLKPGGRMVIPIAGAGEEQQLVLVEKAADGSVTSKNVMAVRFVPFTRGRK